MLLKDERFHSKNLRAWEIDILGNWEIERWIRPTKINSLYRVQVKGINLGSLGGGLRREIGKKGKNDSGHRELNMLRGKCPCEWDMN